jgi:multimeric flavodoxin WrbA
LKKNSSSITKSYTDNKSNIISFLKEINMTNPIIIFGSSRSTGQTWHAIEAVIKSQQIPIVSLSNLNISFYDYEHKNKNDDYLPLMKQILEHDTIILATPVYWYTMSAQMKVFIDRLSDLLALHQDVGRALAGKKVYVITSYATTVPEGFEDAFRQTCNYMKMSYRGCFYYYSGKDAAMRATNEQRAQQFAEKFLK